MGDVHRRDFPELDFTVVAEPAEHFVEFRIYEIEGRTEDGKILWHRAGATHYPDPVESLTHADVFAHGFVKWDGCSDWHFDEQERSMLHACSRRDLTNLGEILGKCRDMAAELCPLWNKEVADGW